LRKSETLAKMPSPTSPAKLSPQTRFSNNDPAIADSLDQVDSTTYQDHPDAPLPIGDQSQRESDQSSHQSSNQNQSEDSVYRCESGSEAEVQNALAQSDPRPIDDDHDDDDAAAAAARPRHAWQVLWLRNKGMALVLLAQMFGASMNVMTQILEIHSAMHPFQVSQRKKKRKEPIHGFAFAFAKTLDLPFQHIPFIHPNHTT
jgi:hypothetical protein